MIDLISHPVIHFTPISTPYGSDAACYAWSFWQALEAIVTCEGSDPVRLLTSGNVADQPLFWFTPYTGCARRGGNNAQCVADTSGGQGGSTLGVRIYKVGTLCRVLA